MAFNGSGLFSKLYSWVVEQASPPIEISKLDAQETDFATGLSNCILRDGTGVPTAATPWNSQNLTGVGNLTASTATLTGALTSASFIPSSSSVPTNGLYLSAANTPALASNSTLRWSVNSTGNHVFAVPSSGVPLTVNSVAGNPATVAIQRVTQSTGQVSIGLYGGTSGVDWLIRQDTSSNSLQFVQATDGLTPVAFSSAGNVTIAAPGSGVVATFNNASTSATLKAINSATGDHTGLEIQRTSGTASDWQFYLPSGSTDLRIYNGADRLTVNSGLQIGAPTGGDKGAGSVNAQAAYVQGDELATKIMPLRVVSGSDNTAATDGAKSIVYTGSGGHTFTADTDLPSTSVVTLINDGSAALTVAASGTLSWYNGSGTVGTGNRTFAVGGVATLWHTGSGNYKVWGTGLS